MDGRLTYRYDSAGQPVALLPSRCKLGRHTLGHFQFRAVVQDGEARISCLVCAAGADHFWRLVTTAPAPGSAELSDERYFELAVQRAHSEPRPQRADMTLNSPFTTWEGDNVHGRRAVLTGVSVQLDQLFARLPGARRHVIETGLDLTGAVEARLHGRFPSVEGDWLGVVNYEIGYADGRRDKLYLVDQLVPFHVLRKRG